MADSHAAPALTRRDHRVFGIGVGLVLGAIAAWRAWRGGTLSVVVFGALGSLLFLGGLFVPMWLDPLHRVWRRVVAPIAWFNTRLLLAVVYFGILLPTGALRRLFSDPLTLRRRPAATYWVKRGATPGPESYRRQV